jgi:hypothetical protein
LATQAFVNQGLGMTGQNLSPVTVTIGDLKIDAYSAHAGIGALPSEYAGMPQMGSVEANISFQIDLNNITQTDSFTVVKTLFDLCNRPGKADIRPIKIDFWKDQSRQDVHLSMKFDGWISSWHVSSGYGHNHVLAVSLQPKLDPQHFIKVDLSN